MYQHINQYTPVLLFFVLAIAFGVGVLVIAYLVRPNKPDAEKALTL